MGDASRRDRLPHVLTIQHASNASPTCRVESGVASGFTQFIVCQRPPAAADVPRRIGGLHVDVSVTMTRELYSLRVDCAFTCLIEPRPHCCP